MTERTETVPQGRKSRRVVAAVGRGLFGVVGLAAAGVVVAAALWWPTVAPTPDRESATGVLVEPQSDSATLSCFGAVVKQVADPTGGDPELKPVGAATTVYGSVGAEADVSRSRLSSPDVASNRKSAKPTRVIGGNVEGSADFDFSAVQSQNVFSEDFAGYSASSCSEPRTESWVVAGSTATGRASQLLLANPLGVDAQVTVTVFSSAGGSDGGPQISSSEVTVPAKTQRTVSLAGLAPDSESIAVHVEAETGRVRAGIQQSVIRGLVPGGIDVVGESDDPSGTQIIPGFQVTTSDLVAAQSAGDSGSDLGSVVRVVATSEDETTVEISLLTAGDEEPVFSTTATVEAGGVLDIPVADVPDGEYTVVVSASADVVAAARSSTTIARASARSDLAWYPSSPARSGEFGFSTPAGITATATFFASGDEDVTLTISNSDGGTRDVTVPSRQTISTALVPGESYSVTGADGIVAGLSFSGTLMQASAAVTPRPSAAAPVLVFP